MIDTDKLRGVIAERGLSQNKVAKMMGITGKTFYEKMKKGVFDSSEIDVMITILKPDDPWSIFFANHVS